MYNNIKEFIKEEYKFIILLILIYIIFTFPVNYYIITGGGISDISSRIEVEDHYKAKGSFNISYVSELQGRISTYLLSYIMPNWKRIPISDYKYEENESIEDIDFRNDLDLEKANSNSVRIAYELASKKIEEIDKKIIVSVVFSEYQTKLKVKDEIISINGKSFETGDEYSAYLQSFSEGVEVLVLVKRNDKEKEITTKLHKVNSKLILGVVLEQVSTYKTEPKTTINFKRGEAGPSGGLITTLYIYNSLVKKDITHGLKIAGTGTIEEDHTIGEIGEVKYKLLGAESDGADIFIVPKGKNYKTCMKVKKENKLKIKVIGVKTIEEAIEKLKSLK